MAQSFSTPGVYRNEIDRSDVLVAQGISVGGTVIKAKVGPTYPVLIRNETEFINTYGAPYYVSGCSTSADGCTSVGVYASQVPELGYGSYAAIEYLKETNALYVIRDASGDKFGSYTLSATNLSGLSYTTSGQLGVTYAAGSSVDTPNFIYALENAGFNGGKLAVYSSSPTAYDKNIAFTIEPCTSGADWLYAYDDINAPFASSATTATISSGAPIASKVFKLSVYSKNDNASWDSYKTVTNSTTYLSMEPIEVFYGTLSREYDSQNDSIFIEDVVNGNSNYIYVKSQGSGQFDIGTNSEYLPYNSSGAVINSKLFRLGGGSTSAATGITTQSNAWSAFINREKFPVNVLICTSWDTSVKQVVAEIAAKRKDCIALLQSGKIGLTATSAIQGEEIYGYSAPSYVALYSGFSQIYDKYNRKNVWVPKVVEAARVIARTLNNANPWDAPAGIDRGVLPIQDESPILSQDEIGTLYDKNINCTKFMNGIGYVMWGQKTAQFKKSALDRLNVRLNLLYIENNIERSLLRWVFQNNTSKERQRIYFVVDEFLKGVKVAGGLYDYKVVCDDTNNTSAIIDTNQLIVDIYVQPVKAAEFITLNTIVTRTGATVTEA